MKKRILAVTGIIFILIQVISFVGMSKMYVGLYPDMDDLLYPSYIRDDSGLNIKKALFAINVGIDRFQSGFEDLRYNDDEYRVMTSTQMASAMIRESLNCSSGGSLGLTIYDIILTISYCSTGILGAILLIASNRVKE